MLCEACNENQATVLVTHAQDGAFTRKQLCRTCAEPVLAAIREDETTGATLLGPAAAHPPIDLPENVVLPQQITVAALARKLRLQPYQVTGLLLRLNHIVSSISTIDQTLAAEACARYGVTVELQNR